MNHLTVSDVYTDYDFMLYGACAVASMTNMSCDETFSSCETSREWSCMDCSDVFHNQAGKQCPACYKHYVYASWNELHRSSSTTHPFYYNARSWTQVPSPLQNQTFRHNTSPSYEHQFHGQDMGSESETSSSSSNFSGSFSINTARQARVPMTTPYSGRRYISNHHSNMCSTSEAPCNTPQSARHNSMQVSSAVLGTRPECVGKESTSVETGVQNNQRPSYYGGHPSRNQSVPYVAFQSDVNRIKRNTQESDELSVTSDATTERKPMCCISLPHKKAKSSRHKALAQKFKKFNKEISQADKSASNSSLKTLAVL